MWISSLNFTLSRARCTVLPNQNVSTLTLEIALLSEAVLPLECTLAVRLAVKGCLLPTLAVWFAASALQRKTTHGASGSLQHRAEREVRIVSSNENEGSKQSQ